MERLGIYGGTFDPPHSGHLALARAAADQLNLDLVLWVLTPNPPHKTGQVISPLADRLAMLVLAIEGQPSFQLSMVDIDRPPPHYAVDTIRLLRNQYPQTAIFYLIGEDSLRDLPRWHHPSELIAAVDGLGVHRREGANADLIRLAASLPGLPAKLHWIDAPLQRISSTSLREAALSPEQLSRYVSPKVAAYIQAHHLYQTVSGRSDHSAEE